MKVLFLTSRELVGLHWWSVASLVDPVAHQAARGEFTTEDLAAMVDAGTAVAGLAMEDGRPVLGVVFEFRHYPRAMTINVMALGGRDLDRVAGTFWPQFVAWAKESGVAHIEACTSPVMTRMLRRIGFQHAYDLVRFPC